MSSITATVVILVGAVLRWTSNSGGAGLEESIVGRLCVLLVVGLYVRRVGFEGCV